MSSAKLLLRWGRLAVIVIAVMAMSYFIAIPILLPRLWPETRLPLALWSGMILLIIALTRDPDSYLPAARRPLARAAVRATPSDDRRRRTSNLEPPLPSDQVRQVEHPPRTGQQTPSANRQPTAATRGASTATVSASMTEVERRLESLLLSKARGDKALVNRLVAYERARYPHATKAELLEVAIARWERDNR